MKTSSRLAAVFLANLLFAGVSATAAPRFPAPAAFRRGPLQVSPDGRSLVYRDGTPFFYLADTAWELLHRLSRADITRYLSDRASKGFNVVQVVVLPELNLTVPNMEGNLPLHNMDPRQPNEAYFALVDFLVVQAHRRGMFVALLPTWGSYAVKETHVLFPDFHLFKADNLEIPRAWGHFLAARYRAAPNIIWVLGGDRSPVGYEAVWRAMAQGIGAAESTPGSVHKLITYHPTGGSSSGQHLHAEPWLSFNMVQSGHDRNSKPWVLLGQDFERLPRKPVLNGEPGYENIPNNLKDEGDRLDVDDVRRLAYASVFAGGCGHTYGAAEIWQMWSPAVEPLATRVPLKGPLLGANVPWHQAMAFPGASQMRHLRALVESRPFLTRVPDQTLLLAPVGSEAPAQAQALRDSAGRSLMVYVPSPNTIVRVRLSDLRAQSVNAWWYDPRKGSAKQLFLGRPKSEYLDVTAPTEGPDWVLVVDDSRAGLPPPGQAAFREKSHARP
ncbi:MAG: DUF4038 domain-containing protein [Deltaproteobacteria bacterium]|nr:DUF4038 domain-containing protein [Deltaproteobacteria bacterium]